MICNNLGSAFLPKSVKHCISYFLNFVFLGARAAGQEEGDREEEAYERKEVGEMNRGQLK